MAIGSKLDFSALYELLDAPVTAFDCGQLCAPANGGVPVCCDHDKVIPVLYKGEFKMLMERTELWRPWKAETRAEKKMKSELSDYALCVCKGAAFCERDNRSLNCRTFPFAPYFDHDGVLSGLVFDYEAAEGKCPLLDLPGVATRSYIEQSLDFWAAVCTADRSEAEFQWQECEKIRRVFGKKNQPVPVHVAAGIREFPTGKNEWRALREADKLPKLIPLARPQG